MKQNGWMIGAIMLIMLYSCTESTHKGGYMLTQSEQAICDSLHLNPAIVQELRQYSRAPVEAFHYSLGKMHSGDTVTELDPIRLPGIIFSETEDNAYELIYKLKDSMRNKGYTIFKVELIGESGNWKHSVGIIKETDPYRILKYMATDGINYEITNDSLITMIKDLDKKYQLELIGASGDYCEFIIHRPPADWNQLAKEVYAICPDTVDQGAGSVEELARELKQNRRLYCWWD
ncbi:DUF4253 domain-containing protein [Niabella pedocola]|uniref:DUF4253 domain-containing protein n=1 Tax=Niabella pedocola TaxID=1752077 RepID=A0ABS8PT58_9BACT|nr:DUF4253 domain-containing protein [Niabella pedocola]MCD2424060.1 DUF4253 domain-containing protein [Niabella pedocola]